MGPADLIRHDPSRGPGRGALVSRGAQARRHPKGLGTDNGHCGNDGRPESPTLMIRLFRHYVSTSLVVLIASETLIFALAVCVALSARLEHAARIPGLGGNEVYPKVLVFALVMLFTMTAMGLYQRGLRDSLWGVTFRIGTGFLFGGFVLALVAIAFPWASFGRDEFLLAIVTALLGVAMARLVFHVLVHHDPLSLRILVLGSGAQAAQLMQLRRRSDWQGINLIGYVRMPNERAVVDCNRVLDVKTNLCDLAREHDVDEIVIAADNRRKTFPIEDLLECKMSGVQVTELLTFFERQFGRVHLDSLYPGSLIFLDGFSHAVVRRHSKRAFDVLLSLTMLVVALPVFTLTALAIWLESGGRGPVFYRQERVGRNGVTFEVLKFRSMTVDAERDGVPTWATPDDDRTTRVGRFIRGVHIDELPQLINVLKGEMSFVGPRPERPTFVETLAERIPYYTMRHRVTPGITGWAQIRYPYGASERDAREKLEYDLYYIKNYSLFLDLIIIFQTAQVVLWGDGAR